MMGLRGGQLGDGDWSLSLSFGWDWDWVVVEELEGGFDFDFDLGGMVWVESIGYLSGFFYRTLCVALYEYCVMETVSSDIFLLYGGVSQLGISYIATTQNTRTERRHLCNQRSDSSTLPACLVASQFIRVDSLVACFHCRIFRRRPVQRRTSILSISTANEADH